MIVPTEKETLTQRQGKYGNAIAGAVDVAIIGAETAHPGNRDIG